jgi:lipase chaperone LimK
MTWANSTEISIDNIRAKASLEIILSKVRNLFLFFVSIFNNIPIEMTENVIYITQEENLGLSAG